MIGIDEVGRGCWAGPLLVVAARQITTLPVGLRDSKKLTKNQRQAFIASIKDSCELGEGWVEPTEIDRLGLSASMRLAVKRALQALGAQKHETIIMDGAINYCEEKFEHVDCVIKADDKYPIVSAASIYAKVKRDTKMLQMAEQYPAYGFDKHVGYGTKMHIKILKQCGVTPIHRKSYKPVQALL